MTTPPKPISFTTEQVTKQKLGDLANNVQWLVENAQRTRYRVGTVTKDTGIKVMTGKTVHAKQGRNWGVVNVYFGSFFTAGCRPVVMAQVESVYSNMNRAKVVVTALSGTSGGIDHNGFQAVVTGDSYKKLLSAVWVNWVAIGW